MEQEFSFDGQRADEKVLLYRHQHPWVLAKAGFIDVFLALIVLAVFLVWHTGSFFFWVFVIMALLGGSYSFNAIYLFKNTFFVLTDQRILNIYQGGIFGRKVQETELINLYNLSYSTNGLIKNLLNFGEIELTTQGHVEDQIVLKNIPAPHDAFEKISKARKRAMNELQPQENPILR